MRNLINSDYDNAPAVGYFNAGPYKSDDKPKPHYHGKYPKRYLHSVPAWIDGHQRADDNADKILRAKED